MRLLLSFIALFLTIVFMQLASGVLGPLDAISGLELGFSQSKIGLLGSAHFLGFFIGCLLGPAIITWVGHSRAFSVGAASGIIGALMHPVFPDVDIWCVLRIFSGFSVACGYSVVESWLQSSLNNKNRTRVFSTYRMLDMLGSLASQGLIVLLTPAHYVSYILIGSIICLSFLPLALTQKRPPVLPPKIEFKPLLCYQISPLAALGTATAGISTGALRMVGPLYVTENGLPVEGVALFLFLTVLGGIIVQWPVGYFSDRFERRHVLGVLGGGSVVICWLMANEFQIIIYGWHILFVFGLLFGALTMPIYSVCVSHANDHANELQRVSLSASLLFFYSLGAIVAPFIAGSLIEAYGGGSLFVLIGSMHIVLLCYTIYRQLRGPVRFIRSKYQHVPRTSMLLSSVFRTSAHSNKDTENEESMQ